MFRSVLRSGNRLRGRPLLQESWVRRCVHVPSDGRAQIASAARRPQYLNDSCGFSSQLAPLARSTERRHDTLCKAQVPRTGFSRVAQACPESSHHSRVPGDRCCVREHHKTGFSRPQLAHARRGPSGSNYRISLHHLLTRSGETVENSRRRAPPVVFHNSPFFDQSSPPRGATDRP